MTTIEWTENLALLADNLRHLSFELRLESPNWFRVAKEGYQLSARTMVEALRGTANLEIKGRYRDKNRVIRYFIGEPTWKEIRKEAIPGCKQAWRYSAPVKVESGNLPPAVRTKPVDDQLIGFFDLLAMIQTECFMSRLCFSNPVHVTDEDMHRLEWLHAQIRNEFEHFMPKVYGAPATDLRRACHLALELTHRLIHEGGTITLLDEHQQLIPALAGARQLLAEHDSPDRELGELP